MSSRSNRNFGNRIK